MNSDVISVSKYLDRLNATLKTERAKIVGEISGVQMYEGRTYLYFSLKDSVDQSTVKCFMWKNDYRISNVPLKDGMQVVVTAFPNIYKPNGGLTLQVELVELVGEGALKIAYDELKKKLEAEGLFADERKREIPVYPHRIGVITSKSGAVINDFLTNIGKFGYEILFVDSKVEGVEAIKDLLSALGTLKHKDIDVLVIMRGGGSLESFTAFNNETLVREVAKFPVPVLTGIGHDKDIPLVALVSDKNVSTPTAVAHLLNSTWDDALSRVSLAEQKIISRYESKLREAGFTVENAVVLMEKKFTSLFDVFRQAEQTVLYSTTRIDSEILRLKDFISQQGRELVRGLHNMKDRVSQYLSQTEKTIELSNPERQLSRGYSIVRSQGKIVRSVGDTKPGDSLDIAVSDGIIHSQTI
jgi:exodeoxyribonuclease VII large subunit